MTLQLVNLGNYANDGTGDDLRTAFQKVNNNFNILSTETNISDGVNLGNGAEFFKDRNVANLEFRTLTSIDGTIVITQNSETVDIASTTKLELDITPKLGGNLNLNGHYIYGGDVQTTVHSIDIPPLQGLLELLVASNQFNIDLGPISDPIGGNNPYAFNLDMNGTGNLSFADSNPTNLIVLDFGKIAN